MSVLSNVGITHNNNDSVITVSATEISDIPFRRITHCTLRIQKNKATLFFYLMPSLRTHMKKIMTVSTPIPLSEFKHRHNCLLCIFSEEQIIQVFSLPIIHR